MVVILGTFIFFQYIDALAHIFNTGQGVVIERSPFSDWIYFDAAYNQGWIDKTTKTHYYKVGFNQALIFLFSYILYSF